MLISLRCPQCQGDLSVEEGKSSYFCPYCGTKVIMRSGSNDIQDADTMFDRWVEAIRIGGDVDMAAKAFRTHHFDDPRIKVINTIEKEGYFSTHKNLDDCISMAEALYDLFHGSFGGRALTEGERFLLACYKFLYAKEKSAIERDVHNGMYLFFPDDDNKLTFGASRLSHLAVMEIRLLSLPDELLDIFI